jgi:hypothetical protein
LRAAGPPTSFSARWQGVLLHEAATLGDGDGDGRPNPKGGPRWTFVFADQAPGAAFYCRLDKAAFKPCGSPKVYRNLKRGRHVFRLKSFDAAGNESSLQVTHFFTGGRRSKH